VLSSGRRCPNSALSGSRYCGLPLHQALSTIETDNVADLEDAGDAAQAG
jgi:N utilization substance protein A